jgi:ferredoxin
MTRKVVVDQEECIGGGTCEGICSEVFRLSSETAKSEAIKPEGGPEDLIQEAIDSCPVSAISWQDL